MACTVTYMDGWPSAKLLKGMHDGKPKCWTVKMRYKTRADGPRTVSLRVTEPCLVGGLAELLDVHLRDDAAKHGGVYGIQWTAISR